MEFNEIAQQISTFLNVDINSSKVRLASGFHENHRLVAEDFRQNNTDVNNPESLLNWYKTTDAYIWELSSYHLNSGFNYSGMCEGIAKGFMGTGRKKVLSIGDGIGTLSIRMAEEGLDTTYHDLQDSKTAGFAQYRFSLRPDLNIKTTFTNQWNPEFGSNEFDGIVALDFFEHLINVEDWVKAVFRALRSNGAFIAQNAFAIGDSEHGDSIPMHLSINNKYAAEWGNTLVNAGFRLHENGQWWIKP